MSFFKLENLSLRAKATFLLVAVVAVSLSLATAINIYQTNRLIKAEQKRAAATIARGLAQAAELPMIVRDTQELNRLLDGFLWNSQLQFLVLYNHDNEIVAKRTLDEEAFKQFSQHGGSKRSLVVMQPIIFRSHGELSSRFPYPQGVDSLDSRNVGRVVVALSLRAARKAQLYQAFVSLLTAPLAAAFGIFLIFRKINDWTRRVDTLVGATDIMKGGDFSHSIPVGERDEIGKLASAFEAMRKALRQRDIELRELNDSLHDQVHERTEKLKKIMVEAQTANESKSSFLANMSHEIRTPMNAIIGMVGLALNKKLSPKLREYLLTVRSSAESLLVIINDILDFSKIEAGKIRLERVDFHLHQLFDKLADLFGDQAGSRNIELVIGVESGVPTALYGDPLRLEQVFVNLLGNAIKFTEQGNILVRATLDSEWEDGLRLLFSVSDSGVGIKEEQYDSLFEPFTQVDGSMTREYGGTGLGLSICRRLVDLHGGEIWVESSPGQGTTVFFTAEFSRQPQEKEVRFVVPATIRGLKVLVVDDNETARSLTANMLETFHFQADAASSCAAATQLFGAASNDYDLILMDWRMPETDGIECIRKFRGLEGAEEIPIIMMTAFGGEQEMVRAREAGADYFLTKPVKQSLLFDTIMEAFNYPEAMHARFHEAEPSVAMTETRHLAGVRVLVAEDNRINQNVARELLESVDIIVEIAANGREAVHILQDRGEEFDAVLMDVQMPVMDGFEASKRIRDNPALTDLPVIAVTAHAMQGDREKCLDVGMNDYVAKPIAPGVLFSVLTRWTRPEHVESLYHKQEFAFDQSDDTLKLPDALPGLYVRSGVARMAGNAKAYVRLLNDLVKFGRAVVSKLPQLVEDDLAAAIKEVHTLKGTAGNLSAHHLQDVSLKLELFLQERLETGEADAPEEFTVSTHYFEIIEGSLRELEESVTLLREQWTEKEGGGQTAPAVAVNHQELLAILAQLKAMSLDGDPVAEEFWVEKKERFRGQDVDEQMMRMENHLRNYNFERAVDFITKIEKTLQGSLQRVEAG
ncbi:MAG: response regulator [Thermodesulfobacteriota bacterium]